MFGVRGRSASLISLALLTAGLLAAPAHGVEDTPPSAADLMFEHVSAKAAILSAADYVAPATTLPTAFDGLDYDAYRKLRPLPETTVWGEAGNAFGILPLPRGGLYREEVRIHLLSPDGEIQTLSAANHIDFVDYAGASADERSALGASGWRAITQPGVAGDGYEFAVFQGATYFRVVGKGQIYGVSARALALGAGLDQPEEFPRFTDFWIFEPRRTDDALEVIALADSARAAAAFHFVLRPGNVATVDVTGDVHPRIDLSEVGVSPLSSMFLRGPADPHAADSRANVHDSEGLSIISSTGEHVWRPLANPATTQVSAFAGAPRRFGLEQRARDPAAYADAEALYERRPTVSIEPLGDWGQGDVRLLEIPTANEYADNVAAFWRPAQPWAAGRVHRIAYRLHWSDAAPADGPARVVATQISTAPESTSTQRFIIDFVGEPLAAADALAPDVWATAGVLSNIQISRSGSGSARLTFDLEPGAARTVELHAALTRQAAQLTETWLFRWTPE